MKKLSICLLLAASSAVPVSLQAAESGVIVVKGNIDPPSCDITINAADSANFNYGVITPTRLSETAYTPLDELEYPFAIDCGSNVARVGIAVTNLKPGTVAGSAENADTNIASTPVTMSGYSSVMGLGLQGETTNKIGGYGVRLHTVTLDSAAAIAAYRDGGSLSWGTNSSGDLIYPTGRQNTWYIGSIAPKAFSLMSGTLAVKAYINKTSELDMGSAIELDGQASIDLIYL